MILSVVVLITMYGDLYNQNKLLLTTENFLSFHSILAVHKYHAQINRCSLEMRTDGYHTAVHSLRPCKP